MEALYVIQVEVSVAGIDLCATNTVIQAAADLSTEPTIRPYLPDPSFDPIASRANEAIPF